MGRRQGRAACRKWNRSERDMGVSSSKVGGAELPKPFETEAQTLDMELHSLWFRIALVLQPPLSVMTFALCHCVLEGCNFPPLFPPTFLYSPSSACATCITEGCGVTHWSMVYLLGSHP